MGDEAVTVEEAGSSPLFREVNERIVALFPAGRSTAEELLCECPSAGCTARVWASPGEFEAVRGAPGLYLVAPGHEWAGARTIARHGRFVVVEASRPG